MIADKLRVKRVVDLLMSKIQSVINNELQFGSSLNRAVADNDASDFRLMLSMLSKDVMDQPQFHHLQQPHHPIDKLANLPITPEQPFKMDADSLGANGELSSQLHNSGMESVRLLIAMQPDALALTDKHDNQLAHPVAESLEPVKRFKLSGGKLSGHPANWQQADLALISMLDTLNVA